MSLFILFSFIWLGIPHLLFPYYKYHLFAFYIYTFLKCVTGIVIMVFHLKNKCKRIHGKKHLIFLLPMIIVIISYLYLIYSVINLSMEHTEWNIDYKMMLQAFFGIPMNTGFEKWFASINQNIISTVIMLSGSLMWLVYWTFYTRINKRDIILLNIITPINITFLYLEILLQFSK
jgi:hypothetical protein